MTAKPSAVTVAVLSLNVDARVDKSDVASALLTASMETSMRVPPMGSPVEGPSGPPVPGVPNCCSWRRPTPVTGAGGLELVGGGSWIRVVVTRLTLTPAMAAVAAEIADRM